ncbi:dihydroxyacetone phosphate acyltransferase-like [Homarus americanus]|uniref:Dihydroxyacetone phosphate acyltransferase-like n=1 Tax=Homarus americanus TaxID=6706 RepID=A0A8J5N7E1_HOMAM|nr:dihydroxyacetone phosphate acyltransferase-like [Homarus americanus]XP_042212000.1 dihydroxyacetone phosphate acyltransferase-like [Homarus americanus]XP_042212001.1 dihydroxyacetone phosphate acyltransferase-like [Homarus americanus]XP_042212002.1 dihydroxyacetone phosphate acyltransferase-like [Homarus americanus]XP_042212003.1 dihydroxyacetone phosphate acyltransferase-like [Homarus americanus]XP_042212004.1 dihydroxyacetone phosphate acyltransferase-like [Homarus americanus]XP_04221200
MEQPMNPTSSSLPLRKRAQSRHEYIDLLAHRRQSSDLRWAAREWHSRGNYRYGNQLTREEVFDRVMQSDRVKHTISQLVVGGSDHDVLVAEAEGILEQMGHTQELAIIRQFAFVLPKIMKRLYDKVLINEDGVEKLRSTLIETPVVLLPTHRSYADFLLVSYIAYHFDLPLPVIAAGMDFMNMAVIGEKLRGSGAFYIRRSFMDNALYWAVFQEYVQTIVKCTGSPLEFFLEGTRSRSGKSLPPKIGLLGCVSQCWLHGRLPDLAIVPISISYERTLEEKLYAYELLGIPKPQESTSGLLKATSILKECFGDIFVHVGEPLSIRGFLGPLVDRHVQASIPSHLAPLTKNELSACEALGHHMLRKIQSGVVVSVWSVVCIQLLRTLWTQQWSLPLKVLVQDVSWLIGILERIGGNVAFKGRVDEAVIRCLKIHCQVASLGEDGVVYIQQVHQPAFQTVSNQEKKVNLSGITVKHAVTHLMLQHYINQAIHLLIRPALVAQSLMSLGLCAGCSLEELQSRFSFLRLLLGHDFIFEKNMEGRDFMDGLSILTWSGEVSVIQGHVHVIGRGSRLLNTLLDLLRPFNLTYTCAAQTMASQDWIDNGALVLGIQECIERSLMKSGLYSALSLDTVRHAVRALSKMGALTKDKGIDGQMILAGDTQKLHSIVEILGQTDKKILQPKL